jgi:hypothetical protein
MIGVAKEICKKFAGSKQVGIFTTEEAQSFIKILHRVMGLEESMFKYLLARYQAEPKVQSPSVVSPRIVDDSPG